MKKTFKTADIENFDRLYRRHFCNGLTGYKSPMIVGSISEDGIENAAIFSNVFHVGASPALIGMIGRPSTIRRDTISNMEKMRVYTLNHIPTELYKEGHLTSAKYPAEISEFEALAIETERINDFQAPFVKKSPLRIGLELESMTTIPANGTWFIIGKVVLVQAEEKNILESGHWAFEQMDTVASVGLDAYYRTAFVDRLAYAKYKGSSANAVSE